MRVQARPIFERYHPEAAEALAQLLLPVIEIDPTPLPADTLPPGTSKLGGASSQGNFYDERGERMVLVGEFNLADLAPYDEDGLLPRSGLLSFFLGRGAIEEGNMEAGHWAVAYESNVAALLPASELDPLDGPYAVPPCAVTFRADVHPYGEVWLPQLDGSLASLDCFDLITDSEWQEVTAVEEPSGEVYLLGSVLATGVQPVADEPGEVVLLGLPARSGLPFVDFGNDVAFAFLISREALARAAFDQVRLGFTMT